MNALSITVTRIVPAEVLASAHDGLSFGGAEYPLVALGAFPSINFRGKLLYAGALYVGPRR